MKFLCEFKNLLTFATTNLWGAIAQLVEQRTENPCVPGSIPGGTTSKKVNATETDISRCSFFLFVHGLNLFICSFSK
jgi:hypothetical protein